MTRPGIEARPLGPNEINIEIYLFMRVLYLLHDINLSVFSEGSFLTNNN